MWICSLNSARTAIVTWQVGRLKLHSPVVLVSGTLGLGSLAHTPLLQLQSRSFGFTQMLNFSSQLHGEKLQTQRFCFKKQHSGIAASMLDSQEKALRVCSPLPVKDAGFEGYPFLQGSRNQVSHWKKQREGTGKLWYLSIFKTVFSCSLFKIL